MTEPGEGKVMDELVERLQRAESYMRSANRCSLHADAAKEAADRIEALEAKYNALGHSSMQVVADLGTKLGTAEARIERLKGYAVHDDTCEDHGAYPGSCTCGLSKLLKEISYADDNPA